jgi:hypothetical protein
MLARIIYHLSFADSTWKCNRTLFEKSEIPPTEVAVRIICRLGRGK